MRRQLTRTWHALALRRPRAGAVALVLLGLLFWARLIVITDMPRTAIAEPEGAKAPIVTSRADEARARRDQDEAGAPAAEASEDEASVRPSIAE